MSRRSAGALPRCSRRRGFRLYATQQLKQCGRKARRSSPPSGWAVAAGHRCWCNTLPMSLVPRAGAIRNTRGFIKMVADAGSGEVLGVSMVGHNAGEVIHEAAMGLHFHAKIQDFIDLLHVYPTMAEALKIVAISRFKNPAKLSCCAEC